MEKNVGKIDVAIRLIVGLVALYLTFTYSLWWAILAAIALVTAARRKCLIYSALGISTVGKTAVKKAPTKAKSKKRK